MPTVFRHDPGFSRVLVTPAKSHRARGGKWTMVRNLYMRTHPICEDCRGRVADVVHHIVPCVVDPSRMFDFDNLRALCHDCHQQAHRPQ
jgi:5-methylcytosine-specific restriction protein A